MTPPELVERASVARAAVMGQAELLHREFGRSTMRWKPDGSRVTATDIAISENILAEIAKAFPDDQVFSEELANLTDPVPLASRFSWVLDPIDGTSNYAIGIPHCAISLGLLENGEPVYGAVYDLGRRILMHGGPGFGAWDGDREVRVVDTRESGKTHIGLHRPYDPALMPVAMAVMQQHKIRGLGSATLHLAYVAAGLLDGAIDFNVKIWDIAAAIPLCRAAGGEVHFMEREVLPLREFDLRMKRIVYVAGGPSLCAELRGLFRLRTPGAASG